MVQALMPPQQQQATPDFIPDQNPDFIPDEKPKQEQPGFLQRVQERTGLPVAHPIDQFASEAKQFIHHPLDTSMQAISQPIIGARNLAYNLFTHPIKTARDDLAGGPQFAEDIGSHNWKGAAGDLVGAGLVVAPFSPEARGAVGAVTRPIRQGAATALRAAEPAVSTIGTIAGVGKELGEGNFYRAAITGAFGKPAISRVIRGAADLIEPTPKGLQPLRGSFVGLPGKGAGPFLPMPVNSAAAQSFAARTPDNPTFDMPQAPPPHDFVSAREPVANQEIPAQLPASKGGTRLLPKAPTQYPIGVNTRFAAKPPEPEIIPPAESPTVRFRDDPLNRPFAEQDRPIIFGRTESRPPIYKPQASSELPPVPSKNGNLLKQLSDSVESVKSGYKGPERRGTSRPTIPPDDQSMIDAFRNSVKMDTKAMQEAEAAGDTKGAQQFRDRIGQTQQMLQDRLKKIGSTKTK